MTHPTLKILMASLVAATLGSVALTNPAAAGGSISFDIAPTNAQDAQALKAGLQIYSIVNAVQNGASIKQIGMNNLAGIGQAGSGNLGIVHQKGNGHSGTLLQNGNNNAYGIFQFGENTNGSCAQYGNNQSSLTTVFGF